MKVQKGKGEPPFPCAARKNSVRAASKSNLHSEKFQCPFLAYEVNYEALSFGSHQPRAPDSAPFRTKRRACAGWVRVELCWAFLGWLAV